jgi:hypothetical protein
MFLIETFLPLTRGDGSALDRRIFDRIKKEFTDRFGGVTAFVQSPAEGAWKAATSEVVEDRVVVLQVMADEINQQYWRDFRRQLEHELRQEEILVRYLYTTKI